MTSLLLVSLLLTQAPPCEPAIPLERADTFDAATITAMDSAIRAELARESYAGLSIGVMRGRQKWVAAYGLRDTKKKLPATPETTYRFASITKSMTAVCVMQLVEQGRLQLSDSIYPLVPAYPQKQWTITVEQLLSHLGGVPTYRSRADGKNLKKLDTAQSIAVFAQRPLVAEPGTEYVYTTWGYDLLGAAVEKASGLSYAQYLQKNLTGPAGMTTTALDDAATRGSQHAVGYERRDNKLQLSEKLDVSGRFAGGGTRGSVLDLLAFGRAIVDNTLVKPETMARMQRPSQTREGKLVDYGLGLAAYPVNSHYFVAHAGGQPETTTLLVMLPAEDVVIALAMNLENEATRQKVIANRLIEVLTENGRVRRNSYTVQPKDKVLLEDVHRLYSYGVAYYRWSKAMGASVSSPVPLDDAFAMVTTMLEPSRIEKQPVQQRDALRQAHHPRTGQVLIRVAVEMARVVDEQLGPDALGAQSGATFFERYRQACVRAGCPVERRFDAVAPEVARLQADFARTSVESLERARLDEVAEAETMWPAIEARLTQSTVHWSYLDEMLRLADKFAKAKKPELQKKWLERAMRTHRGPASLMAYGDALLQAGDVPGGQASYKEALEAQSAVDPVTEDTVIARAKEPTANRRAVLEAGLQLFPQSSSIKKALTTPEPKNESERAP